MEGRATATAQWDTTEHINENKQQRIRA